MQYEYQNTELYRPFEHGVSVLDLLFNTGDKAPYYIWGWREETEVKKGIKTAPFGAVVF